MTIAKTDEFKDLLERAKFEISDLRRRNELLAAQMDVVDLFSTAIRGPKGFPPQTVDIVWEIERALRPKQQIVTVVED